MRRGYISLVIPKIAGIHYAFTNQKASPKRLYLKRRNSILENPSKGSRRFLFKLLSFIYATAYMLAIVFNLRQSAKRMLSSDTSRIRQSYKLGIEEAKYAMLGTLHSILYDEFFRKKVEEWLNVFIPERGTDFSDYLRIDFSTWNANKSSFKDLLAYFLICDRFIKESIGTREKDD